MRWPWRRDGGSSAPAAAAPVVSAGPPSWAALPALVPSLEPPASTFKVGAAVTEDLVALRSPQVSEPLASVFEEEVGHRAASSSSKTEEALPLQRQIDLPLAWPSRSAPSADGFVPRLIPRPAAAATPNRPVEAPEIDAPVRVLAAVPDEPTSAPTEPEPAADAPPVAPEADPVSWDHAGAPLLTAEAWPEASSPDDDSLSATAGASWPIPSPDTPAPSAPSAPDLPVVQRRVERASAPRPAATGATMPPATSTSEPMATPPVPSSGDDMAIRQRSPRERAGAPPVAPPPPDQASEPTTSAFELSPPSAANDLSDLALQRSVDPAETVTADAPDQPRAPVDSHQLGSVQRAELPLAPPSPARWADPGVTGSPVPGSAGAAAGREGSAQALPAGEPQQPVDFAILNRSVLESEGASATPSDSRHTGDLAGPSERSDDGAPPTAPVPSVVQRSSATSGGAGPIDARNPLEPASAPGGARPPSHDPVPLPLVAQRAAASSPRRATADPSPSSPPAPGGRSLLDAPGTPAESGGVGAADVALPPGAAPSLALPRAPVVAQRRLAGDPRLPPGPMGLSGRGLIDLPPALSVSLPTGPPLRPAPQAADDLLRPLQRAEKLPRLSPPVSELVLPPMPTAAVARSLTAQRVADTAPAPPPPPITEIVFRQPDVAVAPAEPAPTPMPAPAASPAPAAGGAAPGAPGQDLDDLAHKLYDRIRWRLRAELRLDMERAGLGAGVRR